MGVDHAPCARLSRRVRLGGLPCFLISGLNTIPEWEGCSRVARRVSCGRYGVFLSPAYRGRGSLYAPSVFRAAYTVKPVPLVQTSMVSPRASRMPLSSASYLPAAIRNLMSRSAPSSMSRYWRLRCLPAPAFSRAASASFLALWAS